MKNRENACPSMKCCSTVDQMCLEFNTYLPLSATFLPHCSLMYCNKQVWKVLESINWFISSSFIVNGK